MLSEKILHLKIGPGFLVENFFTGRYNQIKKNLTHSKTNTFLQSEPKITRVKNSRRILSSKTMMYLYYITSML